MGRAIAPCGIIVVSRTVFYYVCTIFVDIHGYACCEPKRLDNVVDYMMLFMNVFIVSGLSIIVKITRALCS